jgi:predicted TPR repeat methyltransferase
MNNWNERVAKRLENDANSGVGMYNYEPTYLEQIEKIRELSTFVLDLGCGTGRLFHHLSTHIPKILYLGIDSSEAMLNIARTKFPEHSRHFVQADVLDSEFLKMLAKNFMRIDSVVANEILIHLNLEQQKQLLNNIADHVYNFKYLFLSIQTGDPKTELVFLEDEIFQNTIQDENEFMELIVSIFYPTNVEIKRYPLVPGVIKVNILVTL